MLLAYGNGLGFGTLYPQRFFSDAPDRDQGYITDYRATLSYLLGTYYEHLTDWSNNYLGLGFSGQIGYNLPVDMVSRLALLTHMLIEATSFKSSRQ